MEKITKKELLEKLGFSDLSDEALEDVFGGEGEGDIDSMTADDVCKACIQEYLAKYGFKILNKAIRECMGLGKCHD